MSGDVRATVLRQCEAVLVQTVAFVNEVGETRVRPPAAAASSAPADSPEPDVERAVARAEALVAAREELVRVLQACPHLAGDPDIRRSVRAIQAHDEAVRAAMRRLYTQLGDRLRQLRAAKRQQAAYQGAVAEAVFVDRML